MKQGDPLSPLLFNMIVDTILKEIPAEIGFQLGNTKINALEFADDLIIIASSKTGMQIAINSVEHAASWVGLTINASKCSTLSIVSAGKIKKVKILNNSTFRTTTGPLPATNILGKWNYPRIIPWVISQESNLAMLAPR